MRVGLKLGEKRIYLGSKLLNRLYRGGTCPATMPGKRCSVTILPEIWNSTAYRLRSFNREALTSVSISGNEFPQR